MQDNVPPVTDDGFNDRIAAFPSLTKSLQVEEPSVIPGAELDTPRRDLGVDQLVPVEDDRLRTPAIEIDRKAVRRSRGHQIFRYQEAAANQHM